MSFVAGVLMGISLLLLPLSASAQSLVQAANNPGNVSVTLTNPQAAGDLNIVVIGWSNTTSSVTSVTDTAGNTYLPAIGVNNYVDISQTIFYAKNIAASPGTCTSNCNTVTVAFNNAPPTPDIRVYEFSGLDTASPLDTSSGSQGGGTAALSGNATTNNAGDLLFAGGTTSSGFKSAGTGYTALATTSFGDLDEDQIAGAAGSESATATLTGSGHWTLQMVAFRAAGQTAPVFAAPTLSSIAPTSGPDTGGTNVTLTGTGFQPGAVVVVGTASPLSGILAINCTLASSTSMSCVMPADNRGPKDIIVENVDNQAAALTTAYTYNVVSPSITAVTPNSGVTNGNTSITITGSNFESGAKVTVGGEPVSNLNVVNTTTITATTPAGNTGAADVVVTNPDTGTITDAGAYTYVIGSGPVNFIQAGKNSESLRTLSSISVLMPKAQTSGDLNVVIVGWGDTSAHTVTITDTAGNTYTAALPVTAFAGHSLSQGIWYGKLTTGSPSNTVTVSFSPGAVTPDVRVLEYRGLDPASPLDTNAASASVNTGTGSVASSGPVTTTFTNNLIIGTAMVGNAVTGATNGFTTVTISANGNNAEHEINGNAVSGVNPSATVVSSPWIMQAVTFHASVNVAPPSFTLSAATPAAVNPGSSASSTITITPQNGFSAAVALSCTVPSGNGLACSLSPTSVTPGSGPAQATLTITTTGPTAALLAPRHGRNLLPLYAIWLPLPGIALAGIGMGSRRRKLGLGLTLFLVLAFTLLLFGCGGGGSSSGGGGGGGGGGGTGGTAAGGYNITVTATSPGVATQSTTVPLTVN